METGGVDAFDTVQEAKLFRLEEGDSQDDFQGSTLGLLSVNIQWLLGQNQPANK